MREGPAGSSFRQCHGQAGGRLGLDANDLYARPPCFDHRPDAGDQAAAADGHDNRVDARGLVKNLEGDRSLAGDHVLVVERMNEREAVALGKLPRVGARVGQVGAMQDHGGAEMAAVRHFD